MYCDVVNLQPCFNFSKFSPSLGGGGGGPCEFGGWGVGGGVCELMIFTKPNLPNICIHNAGHR